MSIFMVGDPDQMMFRFTGARPELMTEEIDEYLTDIQTYFLDVNYRSTQAIINTCSKLIARNYSEQGGPYDQKFMKATAPRPNAPEGEPVQYNFYPTVRDEAAGVVDTILEQLDQGYENGDFFVGSRTKAQLGYLEGDLYRAGIKFISINGSFWDSYHVANVIAFLKLAANRNDEAGFRKCYNIGSIHHTDRKGNYCHHHWMGAEFLRLTQGNFNNMHKATANNKRYIPGVEDLRSLVEEVEIAAGMGGAKAAVQAVMDECYHKWLKAKGELVDDEADSSVLDDLATVKDVAGDYDDLAEFLAHVEEMVQAAKDAEEGNLDEYVVLSTYHRLKGRERKIMIGIGWCEGSDPFDNPRGLLPHTFSLTPPPQNGVLPTGDMSPMEDERCIAFVAVSRAKEKVFLTGCQLYRNYNLSPSRFVEEAGLEVNYVNPKATAEIMEEAELEGLEMKDRMDGVQVDF